MQKLTELIREDMKPALGIEFRYVQECIYLWNS